MKAKKAKAPKKLPQEHLTRCNKTMTESAWLAWVRSALRSKSLRWPPRNTALENARRPYKGPNKLQKWEYQCAICTKWFKMKEVCVDHHPKPAGSILCVADIGEFANNLFCEVSNLRVLCSDDHDVVTLMDKLKISFADAALEKDVISHCKKNVKDVVDFCVSYGYNQSQLSNADKRRTVVRQILQEKSA